MDATWMPRRWEKWWEPAQECGSHHRRRCVRILKVWDVAENVAADVAANVQNPKFPPRNLFGASPPFPIGAQVELMQATTCALL